MTTILDGFYKEGKIELLEPPCGLQEGRVQVILITAERPKPLPCYLTWGKYHTGNLSTLEDFRAAEWHGEDEFGQ
jgi:hypothetical protein